MGHRGHQQHDWSTVKDDGWKVDSGQTRSSSGPHSNPSLGRGPEHSALKNLLFSRGVFPTRGCCGEANTKWTIDHDHAHERPSLSPRSRSSHVWLELPRASLFPTWSIPFRIHLWWIASVGCSRKEVRVRRDTSASRRCS